MLHLVKTERVYPPETVAVMTVAFDRASASIPATGSSEDLRRRLARIILRCVDGGIEEPTVLTQSALKEFAALSCGYKNRAAKDDSRNGRHDDSLHPACWSESSTALHTSQPCNSLLRALRYEDLQRLLPSMEYVKLKPRRVLHPPKLPITHVYFIEDGLVAALARTDETKNVVQGWLIGKEGLAGLPVILGVNSSPHSRRVLVESSAWRIGSDQLRQALNTISGCRTIFLQYAHSVLVQATQTAACNARHSARQRLARFLLMAQDRVRSADLPLTHALVASMLGVRRSTVSDTLGQLGQEGLLVHVPGHIRILDRAKLEACSCACYREVQLASVRAGHHHQRRRWFDGSRASAAPATTGSRN